MPLQATSGAASYDAFGGGVAAVPNYIEDVFSTYLVTGDGTAPDVNNGIDVSGKGGLVWTKKRSAAGSHSLFDTARGANLRLISNDTAAQDSVNLSFTSTGFSNYTFDSSVTYASWTFRKQPKFFDIVTYTGNSTNRTIAHNLGSVPGCIIVKDLLGGDWNVYHRSLANTQALALNAADAVGSAPTYWNSTTPTSTVFSLGTDSQVNYTGHDYVAYIFAHDAGGFGLTGTDNVISCGTFEANNGEVINLGYEPQWLLYKDVSSTSNWRIADTMRGLTNLSGTNAYTIQQLSPNTSSAESSNSGPVLTSTGFTWNQSGGGNKHIYIAIRRGPMKVPTDATKVFAPIYSNPSTTNTPQTTGFPVDMQINRYTGAADDNYVVDRLRGVNTTATNNATPYLLTNSTAAEGSSISTSRQWTNTTFGSLSAIHIYWNFGRAPSFFDEVCYTGTGTPTNFSHNLAVVPELMIVKRRNASSIWAVYAAPLANAATSYLELTNDNAVATGNTNLWNSTAPTSTVFTIGSSSNINTNGSTNVAYLFATCAGVSKVGSYTGTGTTLQIDCGFTGGARFVLIKRTDSTGDWYVWDSARGIVSGNDPYLLLNSTAAEVTNTDYIDTYSAGFEISSTAPSAINASGGTFIFLAIA